MWFETLLWVVFAIVMSAISVTAVSVVIVASRENRIYSAEEKTWKRLAGSGVPVEAVVESVKRSEHELSRGGSQGQTVLAVEMSLKVFDGTGGSSLAVVRTLVDEALLPQFCIPGTRVHLLRDPADASRLAIDRTRTPLEIARAAG
ncbi:hypothetical protein [Variovorax boronicumulans]|uniref:hypothetical protein n=1 Tax=Variovorax boronicumulans TaxID=436515 RepID=UPI003391C4CF